MNRVLLINNSRPEQGELIRILGERQFQVFTAEKVDDVLDFLTRYKHCTLVCDVQSNSDKVLDILDEISARKLEQPIIFIGNSEHDWDEERAKAFQNYQILEHPLNNNHLLEAIMEVCDDKLKRLEDENVYKMLIEQQHLFGVCIIQDNILRYVNKKFQDLFKYEYLEIIDRLRLEDLIAPADLDTVREYHDRIGSGISSDVQFCFVAQDKNGNQFDVESWCGRITWNGKFATQGIISDISERKAFNLREKTYEFRMMNEHKLASIGQLATGIAHNLNTPISVILSNAELMQMKFPNSPELYKIVRQAERMSNIITNILTKSRQEQLQYPQPTDINKLVSNELDFLESNLEFKHNVEKEYYFDTNLPAINIVYSDFSQSIMNILQNSIDAMYHRPEKKISVRTELAGDYIDLTIADTGIGIEEKNYLKLFDPFYTTKPTPMERIEDEPTGTGLGLSTVHNLLVPYGVDIKIDSVVNRGTTFTLKIPHKKINSGELEPKKLKNI